MSYKHITSDDRVRIATLLNEARNQSYIATRLGLSRSSISRELSRNAQQYRRTPVPLPAPPAILSIDGRRARGSGLAQDKHEARIRYDQAVREVRQSNRFYDSRYAHRQALTRRRRANHERQRLRYGANSQLEVHVREMLLSRQWSPEQICGDLRLHHGIRLSPQTIYDYIAHCPDKTDKQLLRQQLRRGGRSYRHHGTKARATARQSALPSIRDRPAIVASRKRLGDIEGDTIVGLDTKDRLITHVDRASGECTIDRLLGYSARRVTDKTARRFTHSPIPLHTATYDRGTEFADYERLSKQTGVSIYFANAYHSWERGSNENLNGLIRQYVPKRTDFKTLSNSQVHLVETKLNTRPRKRYNYRSPIEQRQYLRLREKLRSVAVRDGM